MKLRNLMMNSLLFLSILCFNCTVFAQRETRKVDAFSEVSYALPGQLEISQGDEISLVLEGDKDDLKKIITRVEGNELKIYTRETIRSFNNVIIYLTLTDLEGLSVSGSGDVKFKTDLTANELSIDVAGSSNVTTRKVTASAIDLEVAGSGRVDIRGKTNEIEIEIAGSGEVVAHELESRKADVEIAGSGSAKVWATEKLDSEIAGSGEVIYKGNPLVDAESAGSGHTRPL
jgi:hypothetical protein